MDEPHRPPHSSWWLRVRRWLGLTQEQGTCVWCECGNEMCSCPTTTVAMSESLVTYTCGECARVTTFDFGYPVPVRLPG